MKKRKESFKEKICNLPFIKEGLAWSKVYSAPGFSGASLYNVLSFIIDEIQEDNLTTRANSVAFSLFLSIFPAIIFIFTLLPLIPMVQDYTNMLEIQLNGVIPKNAHEYIFGIIKDITSIQRDGLLSLGVFLALIFSSNGMLTLMSGFDKAYNTTFKYRSYVKKRLIAFVLTVILSFLLIVSLILMVVESKLFDYLQVTYYIPDLILMGFSLIKWVVAVFLVYTGISIIYTYGPSMYHKVKFINIGSMIATFLSLLTSLLFSYFINNFGQFNEIYGSIGALMVIMIWIQFNSFILLVGFELNASVAINKILMLKDQLPSIES